MNQRYLEVTFRRGRIVAAYLYLPREAGSRSTRSEKLRPGLVVDYSAEGKPIGIEMTAPGAVDLQVVASVLERLGVPPLESEELAPLKAA